MNPFTLPGAGLSTSPLPIRCPTKGFWPRISLPPPSRSPASGRRTLAWGRCTAKSCCWWRRVCSGGTGREAGACRTPPSGSPCPAPPCAARPRGQKGTTAAIQSCRKGVPRVAPPGEGEEGGGVKTGQCLLSSMSSETKTANGERREAAV